MGRVDASKRVGGPIAEVLAGEVLGESQVAEVLTVLGTDIERFDIELDAVDVRVGANLPGDRIREACRELRGSTR